MDWKISFVAGIGISFLASALLGYLTVGQFADLFQTLAALSAALIAYIGLNTGVETWKYQYKVKRSEELAKKCLYLIYKLRDDLQNVRHPFISAGEMEKSLEENGLESDKIKDTDTVNRAVYSQRWKSVIDTRNELMSLLLETEVEWGAESKSRIFTINEQVGELYSEVNLFLDARKERLYNRDVLYGMRENDQFSKKIDSSVQAAEDFLRGKIVV